MKFLYLLLLLLVASPANAGLKAVATPTLGNLPGTIGVSQGGTGSNTGNISGLNATAQGASTSRTLASKFADTYSAKDFGALGNVTTAYQCSITSSQATVTCSDYTFTSADIGKYFTFNGAGGSYTANLNTTILSVSSGVATLNANATSSQAINNRTDLSIASGSQSLSSSGYTFVSADVGKDVSINGAGASGIALKTRILSVSGGVAIISAPAQATVSNATGFFGFRVTFGTDDSAALGSASYAISQLGGGEIQLSSGSTYYLCNATIYRNTLIKGDAGVHDNVIETPGCTTAAFRSENYASLSGNLIPYSIGGQVPSWFGLRDIRINGNGTNATGDGVDLFGAQYLLKGDVAIYNSYGTNLLTDTGNTGANDLQYILLTQTNNVYENAINVEMESSVDRLWIAGSLNGYGWLCKGNHDFQGSGGSVISYSNYSYGFYNTGRCGIDYIGAIHTYGNGAGDGSHIGSYIDSGINIGYLMCDYDACNFTTGAAYAHVDKLRLYHCPKGVDCFTQPAYYVWINHLIGFNGADTSSTTPTNQKMVNWSGLHGGILSADLMGCSSNATGTQSCTTGIPTGNIGLYVNGNNNTFSDINIHDYNGATNTAAYINNVGTTRLSGTISNSTLGLNYTGAQSDVKLNINTSAGQSTYTGSFDGSDAISLQFNGTSSGGFTQLPNSNMFISSVFDNQINQSAAGIGFNNGTNYPRYYAYTNGGYSSGFGVAQYSADTTGSFINLGKTRQTTPGSALTAITTGDTLGSVVFDGADGTSMRDGAKIIAGSEGTISTGVVPGNLSLQTANSSGTLTTALKIDSTQKTSVVGLQSIGTTFTISGCNTSSLTGGSTAGKFTSGTNGTCTAVITLGGLTATNGWACFANDLTTNADHLYQTATTTTTATLVGTTATSDIINFTCMGY